MRPAWDSLRLRASLMFGGLALVTIAVVGAYVGRVATAELGAAAAARLHAAARSGAEMLASNLRERQIEVNLLSRTPLFARVELGDDEVGRTIEQLQRARPEYAWIGVVDPDGHVRRATGGLLVGASVAQRPWFRSALHGPYTGDVHEAVLLAAKLAPRPGGEPLRFVDFAAPIVDDAGRLRGVHAHGHWVTDILHAGMQGAATGDGVQTLIVNADGDVLFPFVLIGRTRLPPVRLLRWQLLGVGAVVAALFGFVAYRLATRLSRPIEQLARAARHIEKREPDPQFPSAHGVREVEQLSRSLQGMTQALPQRGQELEALNATLEQRVGERTAELAAANRQLDRLARKDGLTGLDNRRVFDERLHELRARARRSGRPLGVLLIDIDHFKAINDRHGHDGGDAALFRHFLHSRLWLQFATRYMQPAQIDEVDIAAVEALLDGDAVPS